MLYTHIKCGIFYTFHTEKEKALWNVFLYIYLINSLLCLFLKVKNILV